MTHKLKTWPGFLDDVGLGRKTFEVRKNDRAYHLDDWLELQEYNPQTQTYGDRWLLCQVCYILTGGQFGILPGYVVLGIKLPDNHVWPPEVPA